MVEIKEIIKIDEAFLKVMLYEAIYIPEGAVAFDQKELDRPHWQKYYANWGRRGDIGFIAYYGGTKVGAIWTRLFSEENKGYGFVDAHTPELSMALLPKYRGKGIGTLLMQELLTDLAKAKIPQVSLSVDAQNWVYQWYLQLGFKTQYFDGNSFTLLKQIIL